MRDRSAAGKMAKRKGSNFERKIAKLFKGWWAPSNDEIEFQRTPASGGSQLKDGWSMTGDIVTNDATFPWSLECKCNQSWNFKHFFSGQGAAFWSWWAQAKSDAPVDKYPFLVFSKNRYPVMAMLRISDISECLDIQLDRLFAENGKTYMPLFVKTGGDESEWESFFVFALEDFMECVSPEDLNLDD